MWVLQQKCNLEIKVEIEGIAKRKWNSRFDQEELTEEDQEEIIWHREYRQVPEHQWPEWKKQMRVGCVARNLTVVDHFRRK